ncbi:hypothetical protein AWJ20_970 [Sugiyamaella lignohabitans]|uniref:Uncharacterized protein n=1 Tax=Sugiyamaella lignohabitans TaxID=796027 RepID=A0A167DB56_9ASCO|nr:uncharacterized protein AWJ20_970 [Sugiyamaella lignohabitans]ANB12702.1 hypothetical protein AWJ20_970 [Sugiyamaella lignohabitans]
MSFYSQNQSQNQGYNPPQNQQASSAQNLQFFPTNFNTTSYGLGGQAGGNVPSVGGTMTPQGGRSGYSYGVDSQRERLSTGILAAFGTSGYPGEPPLLEGKITLDSSFLQLSGSFGSEMVLTA